jgi:hypothetical protein
VAVSPKERASLVVAAWQPPASLPNFFVMRQEITDAIRAAEEAAIEECAIAARAWLSIPQNENAESLPHTLRRLKRSERVE